MEAENIIRMALPIPLRCLFDYLPPQGVDQQRLIPGIRVLVPFRSRKLVGILIEVVQKTSVSEKKLKRAFALLDDQSIFTADIYQLVQWAADYYHYSVGEVLANTLPPLLRKGHSIGTMATIISNPDLPLLHSSLPILNASQQQAVTTIVSAKKMFRVFLLDGVTGSGKTEVYLRVMTEILNSHQQILVLIPEISLTPQTVERFRTRFPVKVVAWHSNLSEQERLHTWLATQSGEARIIIGTRSAIFIPFFSLGLIIVDEEHDASFKQQDRFRYHARDLAIMRAKFNRIPIVLGSATPSLESLFNVKRQRYAYLSLPHRAGGAHLPQYQLIDIRLQSVTDGLSFALLETMKMHLDQEGQVILFLNRRGFAPILYCTQCAWIAGCHRCSTRMVYHHTPPSRLHCHHCDASSTIPLQCGKCHGATLIPLGIGTQRLEQRLKRYFPGVPLLRIDRDNTKRKNAMHHLFEQVHTHQKAILLGTQMLAKGHHFPRVTLVGIIDADSGLFSADYRATEQMGQVLLQVAGRAGREEKPGMVMIQTRNPEHPYLQMLIQHGYHRFSQVLLKEREQIMLPPYAYIAVFRAEARIEQDANCFLNAIKDIHASTHNITILGPTPALITKRKGFYCQRLLIKTQHRALLQTFLKSILSRVEKIALKKSVKWALDVDPLEVI